MSSSKLFRVVLTGGPCGGKSTALAKISRFLSKAGLKVFLLPETATIMLGAGIEFHGVHGDALLKTQRAFVDTQLAIEDAMMSVASTVERPCVVVMDRGLLDFSAYMPENLWKKLLHSKQVSQETLRDGRYDAVFHLVTAAYGAEEHYTTQNNAVRTEGLEQARALDDALLNAWAGHRTHKIIGNKSCFEDKMAHLVSELSRIVGLECSDYEERAKAKVDSWTIPEGLRVVSVEYEGTVLQNGDVVAKRRNLDGLHTTFTLEEESSKAERLISGRQYWDLVKRVETQHIRKKIFSFVHEREVLTIEEDSSGEKTLFFWSQPPSFVKLMQ